MRPATLTLLALTLLASPPVHAQAPPLTGRVVDFDTGRPIWAATVRADEGTTSTDRSGRFELDVDRSAAVEITVEALGYESVILTVTAEDPGRDLIVRLRSDPIALEGLEVFVDLLSEKFERRRNASPGVVFAFGPEDFVRLDADNGYALFYKVVRNARPCPGRAIRYCIAIGSRDVPITVCIDERPAGAGVAELGDYGPDDFYLIEVYDRGRNIRAYTERWVRKHASRNVLPPLEGGC